MRTSKNKKLGLKNEAALAKALKFGSPDIIVGSGRIKKAFINRCRELEVDPIRLAYRFGISIPDFTTNYIKTHEPKTTANFRQIDFVTMLEYIGLGVRVVLIEKNLEETRNKILEDEKKKLAERRSYWEDNTERRNP